MWYFEDQKNKNLRLALSETALSLPDLKKHNPVIPRSKVFFVVVAPINS